MCSDCRVGAIVVSAAVAIGALCGCGASRRSASAADRSGALSAVELGPETTPPAPGIPPVTAASLRAPLSTDFAGLYRFIRGPLASELGNANDSGDDGVAVFLRMNRALPFGRVNVTVDGVGAEITSGGAGVDETDGRCSEITVGGTGSSTDALANVRPGQVVTVRVQVLGRASLENGEVTTGEPGTAEARVVLRHDTFPDDNPEESGNAFAFALLGCPRP
jgi:hypothetical protein